MNNKGFTLLELLVVLIIISLMSALVGPRLAGSLTSMNIKTASRKVSASLRYARSKATSERITYISVFDFDKNRLMIMPCEETSDEIPGICHDEDSMSKSKVYNLPEGVRFENPDPGSEADDPDIFQIVFYPSGTSSGGEVIIVGERKKRYTVSVDFITGTVRLK